MGEPEMAAKANYQDSADTPMESGKGKGKVAEQVPVASDDEDDEEEEVSMLHSKYIIRNLQ